MTDGVGYWTEMYTAFRQELFGFLRTGARHLVERESVLPNLPESGLGIGEVARELLQECLHTAVGLVDAESR